MKYIKKRDALNPIGPGHLYIIKWIKPYIRNKKILDIGCWTGTLEQLLKQEKCNVSGIDIEEEPLKVARKKFPSYTFKKASITEQLPFKKNEFDIALYFMVIEHIPQGMELNAFKNINRVTKKGGLLFMSTMNNNPLSKLFDPGYFLTGHRHYGKKSLGSLLKKSGFKIVEVKYNGGFYTAFHMFLLYFSKHILKRNEPKNKFLDFLISRDYRDQGFSEIHILAKKIHDL